MDNYLSTILDLAAQFGGTGFYAYHILFTSQAAARLHQLNQDTYWGALDFELYCRVFAANPSLPCNLCGAPAHPATECVITAPLPRPLALTIVKLTITCCITSFHHPQACSQPHMPAHYHKPSHATTTKEGGQYSFRETGWFATTLTIWITTRQAAGSSTPVHSAPSLYQINLPP